ncbi:hypothetical protein [Polynucleobacter sp. MG-27-Goln-C1]|nr:hypothetical protein [Polynucleobacter sp. MG-27-Goln-C1]
MNQMMDGFMIGGMGIIGALLAIALILSIASLCKYLFSSDKR